MLVAEWITYLQFADDTIFIANAKVEELHNLKLILLILRGTSGHKIDLDKSTLSGINETGSDNYIGFIGKI